MPDINKAFQWAVVTCNAPNVGYSQTYRNQRTVGGITYYDCSSFIWYALLAGGWDVVSALPTGSPNPVTTPYEVEWLLNLGWTEVTRATISNGDVCWRSGHTEMVYDATTGQTMGAHTSGRALADQVSITSGDTASNFTRFFTCGGATGGYGYSAYVVAALCGNAYRESHIVPNQAQVGGTAYGLFQWDGSRLTDLYSWLSSNGYTTDDGNAQCEYLIVENDWIQQSSGSGAVYSSLQDFLTSSSTNLTELTEAFCYCWERPGTPAMSERLQWANKCYDYILLHANDTSITSWYLNPNPTTTYVTNEDYILNNAVMLYRFFSAGGGSGGTISDKNKYIPIYMYQRKRGLIIKWR